MGHLGHGYFWLKLYKERSYKVGQLTIALYQYQDSVLLFCGKDYLSPEFVSIISEKSACITASRLQEDKTNWNHCWIHVWNQYFCIKRLKSLSILISKAHLKDHNCLYANMLFCLKSKSYALYISKLQNVIKISYNHHNMLFCNHFCIHT